MDSWRTSLIRRSEHSRPCAADRGSDAVEERESRGAKQSRGAVLSTDQQGLTSGYPRAACWRILVVSSRTCS